MFRLSPGSIFAKLRGPWTLVKNAALGRLRHPRVGQGAHSGLKSSRRVLDSLSPIALACFSFVALGLACRVAVAANSSTPYCYFGGEDAFHASLSLTTLTQSVEDPEHASVIVINNAAPDMDALKHIRARVEAGAGLIIVPGDELNKDLLSTLGLKEVDLSMQKGAVTLSPLEDTGPLFEQINWRAASQVRDRVAPAGGGIEPLITAQGVEEGTILGTAQIGKGRVYLLAPVITSPGNAPFRDWFYFHYLVYSLLSLASGQTPVHFADFLPRPFLIER